MKKVNKLAKYLLIASLIATLGIPSPAYALEVLENSHTSDLDRYVDNTDINKNASLLNGPIIINEGKPDHRYQIDQLEESIYRASVTSSAAQFLIDNSPQSIKPIRKRLEKDIKYSRNLIKEAEKILATLRKETPKPKSQFQDLERAYKTNVVIAESARMLLISTPQTVRKIEKKLIKRLEESEAIAYQAEALLDQEYIKNTYKIKNLARKSTGLYFATPGERDILNYWRNYKTTGKKKMRLMGIELADLRSNIYARVPDIANQDPGMLSKPVLKDINHITNTMRYSLGLGPVGLDDDFSYYAMASSVINSLNDELEHDPVVPEGFYADDPLFEDGYHGSMSSNIAVGYTAYGQIFAYIMDDDDTNWDVVGHRLNILNPLATNFGYGYYDNYSANYCAGDTYPATGNELVPYPSNVGIAEMFSVDTPFSIGFADSFDVRNITITMTNLQTGRIEQYKTGYNIYTTPEAYYGNMKNISWGLGHPGYHGDQFNIKVDGLTKNGLPYPLEYTVNFISLEYAY